MDKVITIPTRDLYPMSVENFYALVEFFFYKNNITGWTPGNAETTYDELKHLKLYEVEYLSETILKSMDLFNAEVNSPTISNLYKYALDAYFDNINGSQSRRRITKTFQQILISSVIL
jgi:hypothetical protein